MITLTIPAVINSVLGGNVPVNYDKLIVTNIRMDSRSKSTFAQLLLTSTVDPQMQDIQGNLEINFIGAFTVISVPQLDFYRRRLLNAGQQSAVSALVIDTQNSIEAGLIGLGLIAGTQSAGV